MQHAGGRPAAVAVVFDAAACDATARAEHRRHARVAPRHRSRPVRGSTGHVDVVRAVLFLVKCRLAWNDGDLRLLSVGLREEHAGAVQRVPPPPRGAVGARRGGHGVRLFAEAPGTLAAERSRPGLAGQALACARGVVHLRVSRAHRHERRRGREPHHHHQGLRFWRPRHLQVPPSVSASRMRPRTLLAALVRPLARFAVKYEYSSTEVPVLTYRSRLRNPTRTYGKPPVS